jgi:protein-disulfide isomerase
MTQLDDDKTRRPPAISIAAIIAAPLLILAGLWFVLTGDGGHAEPGTSAPAASATDTTFSADQRLAIEGIVKDYLMKHPEILLEVQTALETKAAEQDAAKTKALVAEHAKDIYRSPNAPLAGNPDGDITVVEFFDYNCGYCRRGFSEIQKLVESDKTVRVVFAEFPILGDDSVHAAKVALAARKQGKYWEVHSGILSSSGKVNEATALKVAEKVGLDMTKLKADMGSPEVQAELDRVKDLAQKLAINGTPHFLVGDRAVQGAPEDLFDVLEGHVAEMRKAGCKYC